MCGRGKFTVTVTFIKQAPFTHGPWSKWTECLDIKSSLAAHSTSDVRRCILNYNSFKPTKLCTMYKRKMDDKLMQICIMYTIDLFRGACAVKGNVLVAGHVKRVDHGDAVDEWRYVSKRWRVIISFWNLICHGASGPIYMGKPVWIFLNLQCDCHCVLVCSVYIYKTDQSADEFHHLLQDLTALWINGLSHISQAHIFSILRTGLINKSP